MAAALLITFVIDFRIFCYHTTSRCNALPGQVKIFIGVNFAASLRACVSLHCALEPGKKVRVFISIKSSCVVFSLDPLWSQFESTVLAFE